MPLIDGLWVPDKSVYRLVVEGLPLTPNALSKASHWSTRADNARRFSALAMKPARDIFLKRGHPFESRVRISITLVRRAGPACDPDGALSRCKPVIDGLVRGGLLHDDGPRWVTYAPVQQQIGPTSCVIVDIQEIDALIA